MDEAIVEFVDISELTWQKAKSLSYVTSGDIAFADRYIKEEDKVAHIVSAYLKRKYVGDWQVAKSGKPIADGKHFNVSHTQGAVVFAKSRREIGVDVEKIRPADEDLRRYVASDEEYQYISDDKTFFEIWTAKESLVKATGDGINVRPNEIPALPIEGKRVHEGLEFFSRSIAINDYVISITLQDALPFVATIVFESL